MGEILSSLNVDLTKSFSSDKKREIALNHFENSTTFALLWTVLYERALSPRTLPCGVDMACLHCRERVKQLRLSSIRSPSIMLLTVVVRSIRGHRHRLASFHFFLAKKEQQPTSESE